MTSQVFPVSMNTLKSTSHESSSLRHRPPSWSHLMQLFSLNTLSTPPPPHSLPLCPPQSPPKGATIPYRPKPASTPVIFSGGQVRADPLGATTANLSLLLQHQPLPVSVTPGFTHLSPLPFRTPPTLTSMIHHSRLACPVRPDHASLGPELYLL